MSENKNELKHYGIHGMRWGVRRYENSDGTLTEAEKKRYAQTGKKGYTYESLATKHHKRKFNKAVENGADENKINKMKARYERSKTLDKKEEEFARDSLKKDDYDFAISQLNPFSGTDKISQKRLGLMAAQRNVKISDISKSDRKHAIARSIGRDVLSAFTLGIVPDTEFRDYFRRRAYVHAEDHKYPKKGRHEKG